MRSLTVRIFMFACIVLAPAFASAQTSSISGVVKDDTGAVMPGVTVEAASPALIEKVRSTTTSGNGQYSILALRPGTYTVTFTLPGFQTVVRQGIELTSDFTATINVDLKVGTLEETLTVTGESPIVDTQSLTQRVVMTAEVREALPTGRNIQAVGIMIPGTTLAQGGGGALSRDVGGSGNLQQSPLQYRGSGDTVQTIEGIRLNNLCAQGAYSGVYWNDASFEEFSYVTGADSAEMGQGGMRVNMVPKDGGNSFRGSVIGNYAGEGFGSDNCGSPGIGQALHALEPERQQDRSTRPTPSPTSTSSRKSGTSTRRSAARSSGTRCGSTTPSGTWARPRPRPTPTSTRTRRSSSTHPTSPSPAWTMATSRATPAAFRGR